MTFSTPRFPSVWRRRAAIATTAALTVTFAGYCLPGQASEAIASIRTVDLHNHPLELDLVESNADLSGRGIVTSNTISMTEGLTLPSLWWAQQQFGGKLLEHWLAYSGADGSPRRVDLVVDRQLWSLYNYLERYTFVHQFGTAAKDFGYSTRVFNDQGDPLATYSCAFVDAEREAVAGDLDAIACRVTLDSPGISVFQERNSPFSRF
ncbi:MAG: hypothetical protein VKK04_01610 [Synechococcales bacterium]|nr:hypothetical protein [Synechococcales bacterium]